MFGIFKQKNSKPLGQLGEEFAQEKYKKRGYEIIAANFFNRKGKQLGEIDFIAKNKKEIVFVEVKTRKALGGKFGTPEEAVNQFKQIKLLKAAKVFLQANPKYLDLRPQIDVCAISYSELDKQPFSVKIITNAVEDWD